MSVGRKPRLSAEERDRRATIVENGRGCDMPWWRIAENVAEAEGLSMTGGALCNWALRNRLNQPRAPANILREQAENAILGRCMSELIFPPKLVERCAHIIDMIELSDGDPLGVALAENFRIDDLCETAKDVREELDKVLFAAAIAVLRESGHAEIVAALTQARSIVDDIDVGGTRTTDMLAAIDAALRKAGAL